jgi:hypothetical protein
MYSMSRWKQSQGMSRSPEDLLGAAVAPARLVVAERPQRRQRHAPGQLRVAGEHIPRRGASEDVGDHVAARRLVADALRVGLGQVDLDAVRVVEEDAVRSPVAQREHERDRRVEVVLRGAVAARRVDVPEQLPRRRLLEPARALAAAEEARMGGAQVVHPHRWPDLRRGVGVGLAAPQVHVVHQHRPVAVGERDAQRLERDDRLRIGSVDLHPPRLAVDLGLDRLPLRAFGRLRGVLDRPAVREVAEAEDVRRERRDLQQRVTRLDPDRRARRGQDPVGAPASRVRCPIFSP